MSVTDPSAVPPPAGEPQRASAAEPWRAPSGRPGTLAQALLGVVLLAALLAGFVVWLLRDPRSALTVAGLVAFFFALALLGSPYPWVDRAVHAFFRGYLKYSLLALGAVAPFYGFYFVARFAVDRLPLAVQVVFFSIAGILLAAGLWVISTDGRRARFFASASALGRFTPVAYALNLLAISLVFFAYVTFLLIEAEALEIERAALDPTGYGDLAVLGSLQDFFLWHFLDAVPLLDINETLQWEVPFSHESSGLGWILLLFKVAVILPVIGAFAGYWKYRAGRTPEDPGDEARSPRPILG